MYQTQSIFSDNFIQIAGILNREEADLLVSLEVPYIGFPFRLDYHREDLSPEQGKQIIKSLPPQTRAVLITYLRQAGEIIELSDYLGTGVVQLHADITVAELDKLRTSRRDLKIIKSVIIGKSPVPQLFNLLEQYSPLVDAFITDTYDPVSGATGATGKTHDWEISHKIVNQAPVPVILAGGLNPDNIRDAILKVRPAGADVHSGVEDALGRKHPDKIKLFMKRAARAFSEVNKKAT